MKYFKLTILLFFSSTFNNYSQNYIAEYEIFHDEIEIKEEKKEINFLKELHTNRFTYILKFNDSISIFEEKNVIKESEYNTTLKKISKTKLGLKYTYFENKSKLAYTEFEPKIFIKDTINNEWELTTETKKIDSLLCYKAILKRNIINRLNETKTIISTAWYAPSLPYSYAPLTYQGLPGLIVELTFLDNHYVLKKLFTDVSDKEFNLKIPSGKLITRKEYIDRNKIE